MTPNTLFAFLLFALATSITPGPNNILLMTSGVNHGFRGTIPHMLGVNVGFTLLLLGAGLGLNEVFGRFPAIYVVMKWLGAIYFIYFAWRLSMATSSPSSDTNHRPTTGRAWRFRDGLAFQWINPKGWIMAVGAFSSYIPAMSSTRLIVGAALLFALIGVPCSIAWVAFGSQMRHYLEKGNRRRAFNVAMGLLLIASLVPLFLD